MEIPLNNTSLYSGRKNDLFVGAIDRVLVDKLCDLRRVLLCGNNCVLRRAIIDINKNGNACPLFLTFGHYHKALNFDTTRNALIHTLVVAKPLKD